MGKLEGFDSGSDLIDDAGAAAAATSPGLGSGGSDDGDSNAEEEDGDRKKKRRGGRDWPHYGIILAGLLAVNLTAEWIGSRWIHPVQASEVREPVIALGSGTVVAHLQTLASDSMEFSSNVSPDEAQIGMLRSNDAILVESASGSGLRVLAEILKAGSKAPFIALSSGSLKLEREVMGRYGSERGVLSKSRRAFRIDLGSDVFKILVGPETLKILCSATRGWARTLPADGSPAVPWNANHNSGSLGIYEQDLQAFLASALASAGNTQNPGAVIRTASEPSGTRKWYFDILDGWDQLDKIGDVRRPRHSITASPHGVLLTSHALAGPEEDGQGWTPVVVLDSQFLPKTRRLFVYGVLEERLGGWRMNTEVASFLSRMLDESQKTKGVDQTLMTKQMELFGLKASGVEFGALHKDFAGSDNGIISLE